MKKIVCLILAAAFLLFAGCQAEDSSKIYTTDEIIQKIEKDKKTVQSEEDRKNLVYVIKTVSDSEPNRAVLSSALNCFVEDSDEYAMPFSETITVYPAFDINTEDGYTDVTVNYKSDIDYVYHCKDRSWTIEIKK